MWFWIWAVLLLAALAVIVTLGWRLFVAVKKLLGAVGEASTLAHAAGAEAERVQQVRSTEQAARHAAYEELLAERARPVPRPLALLMDDPRLDFDAPREARP